jgi:hypothetical protein
MISTVLIADSKAGTKPARKKKKPAWGPCWMLAC